MQALGGLEDLHAVGRIQQLAHERVQAIAGRGRGIRSPATQGGSTRERAVTAAQLLPSVR